MKNFKPIGITHITIRVNNIKKSEAFYTDVLGFEVERRMGQTMTVYRVGTDSIVLVEAETAYDTVSRDYRVDHFGFNVESNELVDEMAKWCREHEVTIINGPGNRKNGRYLFITDPDGNMIEIFHEDTKK
jgi:catechol 2,3-dioxygenase-like lactoylglutathione lyase family enzyme